MRDSALKRFLVGGYFNAVEVRDAARGMFAPPRFGGAAADYDAYWAERGPGRQQPRFEIIARGIQPGARVLDVGCGDGAMLEYLAETRRIAGIGLDISSRAVARARERGLDARVGTLDGASGGEFSDGFEHVVLSEVVEHVADAETFVQAGWRLAQRTLWLTFPNIDRHGNPASRMARRAGRSGRSRACAGGGRERSARAGGANRRGTSLVPPRGERVGDAPPAARAVRARASRPRRGSDRHPGGIGRVRPRRSLIAIR